MTTTPIGPASPAGLPSVPDAGHAGHGVSAGASTAAPSFSTAYAQALTAASAGPSRSTLRQTGHPAGAAHAGGGHSIHETALSLRAYRLQLLASNVANADTPGYKAVDIDVEEALRNGQSIADVPVKYHVPRQSSLDGNTVEMDVERAKFADAAIRYQFSLDRAINHYMHIADLFKTLKD